MCQEKENLKQAPVNTAGLRLPILRRPACKVGAWLANSPLCWYQTFLYVECLTGPKLFVQTVWFMLNIHFPSGSLESWYMPDRGCLRDQPWVLSPQRASLGDNTLHMLSQLIAGGIKCVL